MRENNSDKQFYKTHLSKAERKDLTNQEKTVLRKKEHDRIFWGNYVPSKFAKVKKSLQMVRKEVKIGFFGRIKRYLINLFTRNRSRKRW